MTPADLAAQCVEQLNKGLSDIQLVLPGKPPARMGVRVVVFGRKRGEKRLFGEPCCVNSEGRLVVWVKAIDCLAYLAAAGLVNVEATP